MQINDKTLFYTSILISCYFILLLLNAYVIKSENVVVGFLQELFTIALLILQLVLLFVSIKHWAVKDNFLMRKYSFWTFLILFISNAWTLSTLFISNFLG